MNLGGVRGEDVHYQNAVHKIPKEPITNEQTKSQTSKRLPTMGDLFSKKEELCLKKSKQENKTLRALEITR